MKNKSVLKEFSKYTIYNVLGMLGLSCYILADTFFVAKGLGTNGLAALNLAIPIYSIIHGSGLMLGMGSATKFSIFKSLKEDRKANEVFTNTLRIAFILSILFILLGLFFSQSITSLLGANFDVFLMTNTYLKVILLFSPAFLLNDIFVCMVRNDGNPKLSMIAMIIGSLANVVLDYIFIFPMEMGIFGAVFATGLAPIISMLVLSLHLWKKKNTFCIIKTKLESRIIRHTLSLGIPSLITELSSGIVIIIFNMIILNLEGNVGVAAYGIIANLSLVVVAIFTGIAQGIQPILSQAHALHDQLKSKQILRYALLTMISVSIIIYLFICFNSASLIQTFNSENNLLLKEIATQGLILYFLGASFIGFNIILSIFFTSTERAFPAHIISVIRGLILIIPMAFLLSHLWGIRGVWLTMPISELIIALLACYLFYTSKPIK